MSTADVANCTDKPISLIRMRLHGACIPAIDPFQYPVTTPPKVYEIYDCKSGVFRHFSDSACLYPVITGNRCSVHPSAGSRCTT